MKATLKLSFLAAAVVTALILLFAGCTFKREVTLTTLGKDGSTNITKTVRSELYPTSIKSISSRWVGLEVAQSETSQTPHVRFGWGSERVLIVPTDTNVINSPNFVDLFGLKTTWGGGVDIQENTGSGKFTISSNSTGQANASVAPESTPQFLAVPPPSNPQVKPAK